MAKPWLLSWTLAMPTLPVLELSLRVGSPFFHVIHQLESAVSDWFVFSLLFFICCGLLFFFFSPEEKLCMFCACEGSIVTVYKDELQQATAHLRAICTLHL